MCCWVNFKVAVLQHLIAKYCLITCHGVWLMNVNNHHHFLVVHLIYEYICNEIIINEGTPKIHKQYNHLAIPMVTFLGWWVYVTPFKWLLVTSKEGIKKGHELNHLVFMYIYIYIYTSTFKGVPNGSQRVSIHHPLGFNWHPFEGPGTCCFAYYLEVFFQQRGYFFSERSWRSPWFTNVLGHSRLATPATKPGKTKKKRPT